MASPLRSLPAAPRRLLWFVALLLALALLLPFAAAAAQLAELRPGARVRLRAPGAVAGRIEGVVVARTADTVSIATAAAAPFEIPVARISRAEVSRGRSRGLGALKGAAWGAGVGVATGLLGMSGSDGCAREPCDDELTDGEYLLVGGVSGATVGAIVGVFVGAERWARLALPAPVAVGAARGGVAATVRLRF